MSTNFIDQAVSALGEVLGHLDNHRTEFGSAGRHTPESLAQLSAIEQDVTATRLRLQIYARRIAGDAGTEGASLVDTLELHSIRLAQAEIELGRARLTDAAQCADAPERLAGASARAGDAAELVRAARRQIIDAD